MAILDDVTGATVAYSTRKLRSAYAGNAIRVREDGGDTEADIGFDGSGNLDESAIASHCGANNGYVTKWYDQSGNSRDAFQTTTTKQPLIYNGSAVLKDDGSTPIAAPDFDGGDALIVSSFTAGIVGALTDHSVYASVSSDGPAYNWQAVLGWDTGSIVRFDPMFFNVNELRYYDGTNGGGTGGSDLSTGSRQVMTSLGDDSANTIDLRLDGVAKITSGTHTNQTVGDTLSIGGSRAGGTGFFRGHIAEVIFWHQTLHGITDRDAVEAWLLGSGPVLNPGMTGRMQELTGGINA